MGCTITFRDEDVYGSRPCEPACRATGPHPLAIDQSPPGQRVRSEWIESFAASGTVASLRGSRATGWNAAELSGRGRWPIPFEWNKPRPRGFVYRVPRELTMFRAPHLTAIIAIPVATLSLEATIAAPQLGTPHAVAFVQAPAADGTTKP